MDAQIKKANAAGYTVEYWMKHGNNGKGMTREQAINTVEQRAMSDFVADSLETMFSRGDAAEAITRLKEEDRGLFDKIKEFVDQWVSTLKQWYSDKTISKEGKEIAQLERFEELQKLFLEATAEAGENYQSAMENYNAEDATNEKSTTPESDDMHSDKNNGGYGGIREVLAKKGLDALSKRFGDRFPLSSKFDAAMRADNTKLTMEIVQAGSVKPGSKESAYKAGRKAFIAKYGTSTSVYIKQMGIDAMLYADVAKESISKAIGQSNEQSTLDVIPHIREILSDSVLMGMERIRHTDDKGTVLYGYRLYNLYWYNDGKTKVPHAIACTVLQDLNKAEGYVFQNIENVTIDQGLPGNESDMSPSVDDDTYTVAQLYKAVKRIGRDSGGLSYTQKEKDAYGFAYTETDDGELYSLRNTPEDVHAVRRRIADAMDAIAVTPPEKKWAAEYREKIAQAETIDSNLKITNRQIQEKTQSKNPADKKDLSKLKGDATRMRNDLDKLNRRLHFIESLKSFRETTARETKAYGKAMLRDTKEQWRENIQQQLLENRVAREELTGKDSDLTTMEKEFLRIIKAYENLDTDILQWIPVRIQQDGIAVKI